MEHLKAAEEVRDIANILMKDVWGDAKEVYPEALRTAIYLWTELHSKEYDD